LIDGPHDGNWSPVCKIPSNLSQSIVHVDFLRPIGFLRLFLAGRPPRFAIVSLLSRIINPNI
ncbi:hypothetical protein L9F63_026611, partial [Diploptera punctata]